MKINCNPRNETTWRMRKLQLNRVLSLANRQLIEFEVVREKTLVVVTYTWKLLIFVKLLQMQIPLLLLFQFQLELPKNFPGSFKKKLKMIFEQSALTFFTSHFTQIYRKNLKFRLRHQKGKAIFISTRNSRGLI